MRSLAGILLTILPAQSDSLRERLTARIESIEGTVAVAFHDLATNTQILINDREMFHAASTMKTPVMVELFRQADEGGTRLDDSLLIENSFRSIVDGSTYTMDLRDDSDDSMYGMIGKQMTVRDLIYRMITVSSNLAANILVELADARKVTRTMRAIGADSIQVLRGVEDLKAFDAGLNNQTNAYDLMLIFKAMADGSIASIPACKEMIDILADQKLNDLIPAQLPPGTRIAHKTGSITGVEHDGGIVFLADGRKYVLVILSKDLKDRGQGKKAIADISRLLYDHVRGN
ncbi:MAG: serine hydrolase [Bacteroidota bacterium]